MPDADFDQKVVMAVRASGEVGADRGIASGRGDRTGSEFIGCIGTRPILRTTFIFGGGTAMRTRSR
jgi:hypothetical protein